MSKIKYSALVSDVRNKLNGSVLSKNRYGNYIRNKTTPVNPSTTFQQNARAQLAANSQAWGGLTEAQRKGWKALAAELPFTDVFGDSKILAANSMHVKLNGNLRKIGRPAISTAPTKVAVESISDLELHASSNFSVLSALTVGYDALVSPTIADIAVYATPGISPGRSFVKNQFRLIGIIPGNATTPVSIFTDYVARFGNPPAGQKIFVRLAIVNRNSGQSSVPSEAMDFIP